VLKLLVNKRDIEIVSASISNLELKPVDQATVTCNVLNSGNLPFDESKLVLSFNNT
jgi:hypothetical protein